MGRIARVVVPQAPTPLGVHEATGGADRPVAGPAKTRSETADKGEIRILSPESKELAGT